MKELKAIRTDRDLVFEFPYDPTRFYKLFHRLQFAAGLEKRDHFGLQHLRRTLSTQLWGTAPEAASIALGHSTSKVTRTHYVQTSGILRRAVDQLPQPMGGLSGPGAAEQDPPNLAELELAKRTLEAQIAELQALEGSPRRRRGKDGDRVTRPRGRPGGVDARLTPDRPLRSSGPAGAPRGTRRPVCPIHERGREAGLPKTIGQEAAGGTGVLPLIWAMPSRC